MTRAGDPVREVGALPEPGTQPELAAVLVPTTADEAGMHGADSAGAASGLQPLPGERKAASHRRDFA